MGFNATRPTGFTARASRIPPVSAIRRWSGTHPKSMYSDFEGISKSNVKNRVHASYIRFGAAPPPLGQLGGISGEHGTTTWRLPAAVDSASPQWDFQLIHLAEVARAPAQNPRREGGPKHSREQANRVSRPQIHRPIMKACAWQADVSPSKSRPLPVPARCHVHLSLAHRPGLARCIGDGGLQPILIRELTVGEQLDQFPAPKARQKGNVGRPSRLHASLLQRFHTR